MARILIVGDLEDLTSAYVAFEAEKRGHDVLRLSESRFGVDWSFEADDREGDGILRAEGGCFPLAGLAGAYVRFDPTPGGPLSEEMDPSLLELYVGQRRAAHHLLLTRLGGPVVNPPFAGHSNGSKPFQMTWLEEFGLSAPPWIASNDVDALRDFLRSTPRGAIVKSCSGLRSQVRLADDAFLDRVADGSPPVLLQERIIGFDVRLHTVGDRAFGTLVDTEDGAVDYRFSDGGGRYRATDVPAGILEACRRFAKAEDLFIAGFDFKVDDDGTWWCLECNPAPTFLPYELETGQPICSAVLDLFEGRA